MRTLRRPHSQRDPRRGWARLLRVRSSRGTHRRCAAWLAAPEVTAPMPGKVLKILVAEGDSVEAGDALAVLEAMKMETTLYAESAATVKKIHVERRPDGRSRRRDDRVQSGSGRSISERIAGSRRVSHSSKSPSRSTTISSLPSFISAIRPGRLRAQRNHQRLARNPERIGDGENPLDFLQCDRFQHLAHAPRTPLHNTTQARAPSPSADHHTKRSITARGFCGARRNNYTRSNERGARVRVEASPAELEYEAASI